MNTLRLKLNIVNRSKWPEPFVKIVCRWIAKGAGIEWPYTIVVRSGYRWHGTGEKSQQRSTVSRHYRRIRHRCVEARWIKPGPALVGNAPLWPEEMKDHRFKWSASHTINNRLESFVYLIAHEACHANMGHPNNFRKPHPRYAFHTRVNRAEMEYRCNQAAMEAVIAFRDEWPAMKQRIVRLMREQRAKTRQRKDQSRRPLG